MAGALWTSVDVAGVLCERALTSRNGGALGLLPGTVRVAVVLLLVTPALAYVEPVVPCDDERLDPGMPAGFDDGRTFSRSEADLG